MKTTKILCALGVAATVQTASMLMPTAEAAPFDPAQKTEIQMIIKDYLINNPDVLRDAQSEMDRRQKQDAVEMREKAVTDQSAVIFNSPHQAIIGNPMGKVTLVEFFDYNCPYCKLSMLDVAKLIKADPDLRVVLKDFPVLGPQSIEAARVASAVRNQLQGDKFWQFHEKLLGSKVHVGKAEALAVAQASGVDMIKLKADMNAKSIDEGIAEVMKVGDKLNLTGTPSFVIGTDVIVGAVGYDQMKLEVDNMEKCGKVACS